MAWKGVFGWLDRVRRVRLVQWIRKAAEEWYGDKTFQLGAALAYYAVFSLPALVLLTITIASLVLGEQAARGHIAHEIENLVGPTVAGAIVETLAYGHRSGSSTLTMLFSLVLLLCATTGLFSQLQDALDTIWKVKPKPGRGLWGVIRERFWSFVIVLVIGALVLALLLVNAALALVERFLEPAGIPASLYLWRALHWGTSLVFLTLAFALIYQVLPDADIAWRDVWLGSGLTAVLFLLGNYVISLYLGWSNITTGYGAAGSLVVLLVWVYYSAQILLFGAEFTQVYAQRGGKVIEPAANALPVTLAERARQGMTATEADPTRSPSTA